MPSNIFLDLLIAIGGASGIALLYETIKHRVANKRIKEGTAKKTEAQAESETVKSQKDQLDLIEAYKEKVKKLEEEKDQIWKPFMVGLSEVKLDLKEVKNDVKDTSRKLDLIEKFLDGPFHAWLENEISTQAKNQIANYTLVSQENENELKETK